jgi:hypothetical protein
MKRISMILIACAVAALAGPAMADSMSITQFKPRVMPVLVEVNAHGHVTKILPSTQLTPKLQRLLAENIKQWVVRPASVKGHQVDSQVIMQVALKAVPVEGNKYDVSFTYVSMVQSPFGAAAHWVWKDGHELALVSDDAATNFRRERRFAPPPPPVSQPYRQVQVASHTSPAPSAVHGVSK